MQNKKLRNGLILVVNLLIAFLGCILAPVFGAFYFPHGDSTLLRALSVAVLTVLLIILVIEIISVFKISDSTYHTTLFAAAVFAMYLFSADIRSLFIYLNVAVPVQAVEFLGYLAFVGAVLSVTLFIDYTYRPSIEIQLKKMLKTVLLALLPLGFCLYVGLSFLRLQIIGHLVIFLYAAFLLFFCTRYVFRDKKEDTTYFLILAISSAILGMENLNILYYSGWVSDIGGYPLAYAFGIILMFGYVYTAFIMRSERKIRLSNEYKLQTEQLKATILTQQMKPHFVFNSLATIKAMYHKDLEEGDHALDLFSKQLRSDIEAIDKELIPLDAELEYVANYVDFENIKRENAPINVIFNIDYADFYVPALSLQPLVENAVKHGQLDKKEDGNIIIAAFSDGETAVIEVTDNGIGFDVSTVRKGSCGINNTRARFEMLLDAKTEIKSELNVGTTVTVRINHPRLIHENHHS